MVINVGVCCRVSILMYSIFVVLFMFYEFKRIFCLGLLYREKYYNSYLKEWLIKIR